MSTQKDNVLDRLRLQKATEDVVDRQAIEGEWVQATDDLMVRFASWLEEATREGLFEVAHGFANRTEARLGNYAVSTMRLTTPQGESILIAPRARFVAGAFGRVDLDCPPKKSILVRVEPDRWQFARLVPEDGGWSNRDLTEDSFWHVIGELIS